MQRFTCVRSEPRGNEIPGRTPPSVSPRRVQSVEINPWLVTGFADDRGQLLEQLPDDESAGTEAAQRFPGLVVSHCRPVVRYLWRCRVRRETAGDEESLEFLPAGQGLLRLVALGVPHDPALGLGLSAATAALLAVWMIGQEHHPIGMVPQSPRLAPCGKKGAG